MNDEVFRAFMSLMMGSDPFPCSDEEKDLLNDFADQIAKEKGYSDWIEALHKL